MLSSSSRHRVEGQELGLFLDRAPCSRKYTSGGNKGAGLRVLRLIKGVGRMVVEG
jgi:hypothetical protein